MRGRLWSWRSFVVALAAVLVLALFSQPGVLVAAFAGEASPLPLAATIGVAIAIYGSANFFPWDRGLRP